jgi:hypothetical protein
MYWHHSGRGNMGSFDYSPNATERVIGNIMRFYLEFQGTPLATIDAKEIRKARESYLGRKGTASTSSA